MMDTAEIIERLDLAESMKVVGQMRAVTLADLVLACEQADIAPTDHPLMAAALVELAARNSTEAAYWTEHFNDLLVRLTDGGF